MANKQQGKGGGARKYGRKAKKPKKGKGTMKRTEGKSRPHREDVELITTPVIKTPAFGARGMGDVIAETRFAEQHPHVATQYKRGYKMGSRTQPDESTASELVHHLIPHVRERVLNPPERKAIA